MCFKSVNIIYKMKEVNNLIPLCTIGKGILKTQFLVLVSNLKQAANKPWQGRSSLCRRIP